MNLFHKIILHTTHTYKKAQSALEGNIQADRIHCARYSRLQNMHLDPRLYKVMLKPFQYIRMEIVSVTLRIITKTSLIIIHRMCDLSVRQIYIQ